MLKRNSIPLVCAFLALAFTLPVRADSSPTPSPIELDTPNPDATLALPTGTLEPPVPPTPPEPEPYRPWPEPTCTPPNRAVFTVGFALAAVIVVGMILLGYAILKGRDPSPK